jgi:hypothetical protein
MNVLQQQIQHLVNSHKEQELLNAGNPYSSDNEEGSPEEIELYSQQPTLPSPPPAEVIEVKRKTARGSAKDGEPPKRKKAAARGRSLTPSGHLAEGTEVPSKLITGATRKALLSQIAALNERQTTLAEKLYKLPAG